MKKLKKFFKFIPVLCLSFISCLSSVLTSTKNVSSSYADDLVEVGRFSVSTKTFDTRTNDNIFFPTLSRTYTDIGFYFYKSLVTGNFSFTLSFKIYNGSFSLGYNTSNEYFLNFQVSSLFSSRSFIDNGFNNTLRSVTLKCTGTNTDHDGYIYDGTSAIYGMWDTFILSVDGFSDYSFALPYDTGSYPPAYILQFTGSQSRFPIDLFDRGNQNVEVFTTTIDLSGSNYQVGYENGYSVGYTDGYNGGYSSGYNAGSTQGYEDGFSAGVESQQTAIDSAYSDGYSAGYNDGFSVDSVTGTIFSGILQIGMLPVNVLLAIFNFEILGINIAGFVSAILTVCLTIIVIRTVTGKKE